MNRFEPARGALEKALAADPEAKLWRDHRALVQDFEALGMAVEAERHFREAVLRTRGPERAEDDPRLDFGVFLFRQGRTGEALKQFEQSAKELPGSARAQLEWGRALLQSGKPEQAAARLEKAVAIDPRNWAALTIVSAGRKKRRGTCNWAKRAWRRKAAARTHRANRRPAA